VADIHVYARMVIGCSAFDSFKNQKQKVQVDFDNRLSDILGMCDNTFQGVIKIERFGIEYH